MRPAPQRGTLATGLWLLRNELVPVPTRPREKRPIENGWGIAPPSRGQLIQTFRDFPGAGVGMALGPIPGIVDLEVDDVERGTPLLETLELPPTLGWLSSRGSHRIYRWDPRLPDEKAVHYLAGGAIELRIGGEKKQTFSVCPPTLGENYRRRVWFPVWEISPLPERLLREIDRPTKPRVAARMVMPRVADGYSRAALRNEAKAVAQAGEGNRNRQLNKSAYSLGTLVGAGWLDRSAVEVVLIDAALACGLSEREALATIKSGLDAGTIRPRSG
ncbi:bifunctional DNA primase/polymerase [Isosphaeraceae bacterium EP7]